MSFSRILNSLKAPNSQTLLSTNPGRLHPLQPEIPTPSGASITKAKTRPTPGIPSRSLLGPFRRRSQIPHKLSLLPGPDSRDSSTPAPPPAPHRAAAASLLWPLSPRPPVSCGQSSCSAPPPPCPRRSTCSPWRRRERGPGPGSLTHRGNHDSTG